jgi:hypothetical protein
MSYDSKIESARNVIESHNQNIEDSKKVDFDSFLTNLQDAGGTSEETLKTCSWEDLQDTGVPRLIARTISKIFRQNGDNGDNKSSHVSQNKSEMMTVKDLLGRYNPSSPPNNVTKRLKEICKNSPCIIFNNDGAVNVEASDKLIADLLEGHDPISTTVVNGIPHHVYKVGVRADAYVGENPLYPGKKLRSGGQCHRTGFLWDQIAVDVKQFLHIAVSETREMNIDSLEKANDIIDRCNADNALENFRKRYLQTSLKFDELSKIGNLPSLRILMNVDDNKKSNNPFGTNREY